MSQRCTPPWIPLFLLLVWACPGEPTSAQGWVETFHDPRLPGWSWERENPDAWRCTPDGLQVRVEPGNMWGGANNARNVLIHPIPSQSGMGTTISVTFSNAPTAQWEQADLVWFYDDSNMVKLGQELVTGRLSIVMGREQGDRTRTIAIIPLDDHTVDLRLQQLPGDRIRGQFRTRHHPNWRTAGECDLPIKGSPNASLQFYNGPTNVEHWVQIRRFELASTPLEAKPSPAGHRATSSFRAQPGATLDPAIDPEPIALPGPGFLLINNPRAVQKDPKAEAVQEMFLDVDGSTGWTWNRRNSESREPTLLGIGALGSLPLGIGTLASLPLGTVAKPARMELQTDAVTWLEDDQGDHTLALHVWCNSGENERARNHRIRILLDWYGPAASATTLNDGFRGYEFVLEPGPRTDLIQQFTYRLSGFRGPPPRLALRRFIEDAVRRGLPKEARLGGLWFGNEVWNGSRGGTRVTRFAWIIDGREYPALQGKP